MIPGNLERYFAPNWPGLSMIRCTVVLVADEIIGPTTAGPAGAPATPMSRPVHSPMQRRVLFGINDISP